jgi:hypothetical protein
LYQGTVKVREYEDEANRLRARINATMRQLRSNLEPANIVEELKQSSGLDGVTPATALNFAMRRYPVPTLLVGLGIGVWAYSMIRPHSLREGTLPAAARSLADGVTNAFRDRVDAKRKAAIAVARSQLMKGATHVADAIERRVDGFVGELPATPVARPLVEAAVRLLLLGAFDAMLPRSK